MEPEIEKQTPVVMMPSSLSSVPINKHPRPAVWQRHPAYRPASLLLRTYCVSVHKLQPWGFSTDHRLLKKRGWKKSQEEGTSYLSGILLLPGTKTEDIVALSSPSMSPSLERFLRGPWARQQSPTLL